MDRYLMTHSLLSSWMYFLKGNPYEDMTTERDPYAEFMATLLREPTETTEAMQRGIDFEDLVTDIIEGGEFYTEHENWLDAAHAVAKKIKGHRLQHRATKRAVVSGIPLLLYGRLDALGAGIITDTKFSTGYERGKYLESTQHPMYMELVPDAVAFRYLITNGTEVWSEWYRRDETPSIYPIIADFLEWLEVHNLMAVYKEKWLAR